jgi:hypothetical protein
MYFPARELRVLIQDFVQPAGAQGKDTCGFLPWHPFLPFGAADGFSVRSP